MDRNFSGWQGLEFHKALNAGKIRREWWMGFDDLERTAIYYGQFVEIGKVASPRSNFPRNLGTNRRKLQASERAKLSRKDARSRYNHDRIYALTSRDVPRAGSCDWLCIETFHQSRRNRQRLECFARRSGRSPFRPAALFARAFRCGTEKRGVSSLPPALWRVTDSTACSDGRF